MDRDVVCCLVLGWLDGYHDDGGNYVFYDPYNPYLQAILKDEYADDLLQNDIPAGKMWGLRRSS